MQEPYTQLRQIVRGTPWLWRALLVVRDLKLDSWCVGAGALRNAVWDRLHDYIVPSYLSDIDVAFFDPNDLSQRRDDDILDQLRVTAPDLPWEVTNQAAVHRWFREYFGHSVDPLNSLSEAVASWPEFATSVAVTVDAGDNIKVIAPLGIDDLMGMKVRRNPKRVSVETYRKRIQEKMYRERWPRVEIVCE